MSKPRARTQRLRESAAASSAGTLERGGAEEQEVMREDAAKTCPTCGGDGKDDSGAECPTCGGTGQVDDDGDNDNGMKESASVETMAERDVSTDERKALAKEGKALPDGSFPIANETDLHNAVQAYGRASDKAAAKAHISKRAKALGAESALPDDWSGATKEAEDLQRRIAALEAAVVGEARLRESKPAVLNTTFSTPARVQTNAGQEGYRVILIREGRGNLEDDNWYTAPAIREMCESGIAEGMQAYANHPSLEEEEVRPERDIKQLVGSYQDVTFQEAGGAPRAEAVFVPLTTDEKHPTYGWVITLAEAAARNRGPQPLAGISLYGLSAGEYGPRPDGSEGRVVSMIRPTSGDIVTNAGAGGGFIQQMWESARALRRQATQRKETQPMQVADLQKKIKEATSRLREADSDEARNAAMVELEALQTIKVDAPPKPVDTVEALTEAAPKLVDQIREAAKREAGSDLESLQAQLREAQSTLSQFTDVMAIAETLREAEVTNEVEQRYFVAQARARGLREAADIKDMVETERAYQHSREADLLTKVREASDLPDVEGAFSRVPTEKLTDGGVNLLRESGIPVKEPQAA